MKFDWDGYTFEWTQKVNPLDQNIKNKDLEICSSKSCAINTGKKIVDFAGLSLSITSKYTLLDGVVGVDWSYAVGWTENGMKEFLKYQNFKERPAPARVAMIFLTHFCSHLL